MNYKAIGLSVLNDYADGQEDYTLGELLYSFLRKPVSGIDKVSQLRDLTDEEVYTMIEKAQNIERNG